MNTSTIITGIVIVLLLGFIFVVLPNENNESALTETASVSFSTSASVLNSQETYFDFGTISMSDGIMSHIFEVHNEGKEPVIIKKIYTSCMCTTALITNYAGKQYGEFGMPGHGGPPQTNIEVKPGESISVEAKFDPAAHGPSGVGFAERSIYLETNSQESPMVELSFSALVVR
ncbi:MAG: DUF1573 domain-containing protein [Parcubacteria group bacterium]|nr:DUF1573 domain-containing protein [Parcubacteria group bacterium]